MFVVIVSKVYEFQIYKGHGAILRHSLIPCLVNYVTQDDRATLHSSNECTKSAYPSHTAEFFHTANTITINNP